MLTKFPVISSQSVLENLFNTFKTSIAILKFEYIYFIQKIYPNWPLQKSA